MEKCTDVSGEPIVTIIRYTTRRRMLEDSKLHSHLINEMSNNDCIV